MKATPLYLLFLVFLVLKLCSVITWSWWWVTAPLWLPIAVVLSFYAVFFVGLIIYAIIAKAMGWIQ